MSNLKTKLARGLASPPHRPVVFIRPFPDWLLISAAK